MSYILDALRRADSERERGSVPGIHAQPIPPVSADAPPPRASSPALWIIGGLALALVGSLAWQWLGADDAAHEVAAAPAQPAPATVAAAPATPLPALAPLPAAAPALLPEAVAPRPEAAPSARKAVPKPIARAPARADATSAEALPEARIHALQELPEDVRRELPALAIGGSIYSEHPSNRFLIINGQTFRERDRIAPDLVLEQIGLKAAVLRHKSYRYRINY